MALIERKQPTKSVESTKSTTPYLEQSINQLYCRVEAQTRIIEELHYEMKEATLELKDRERELKEEIIRLGCVDLLMVDMKKLRNG